MATANTDATWQHIIAVTRLPHPSGTVTQTAANRSTASRMESKQKRLSSKCVRHVSLWPISTFIVVVSTLICIICRRGLQRHIFSWFCSIGSSPQSAYSYIYGEETWILRSHETQALDIFDMRCLRVALEILEGQTKYDTAKSAKRLSPLNQYQMSSDIGDSGGLKTSVVRQANAN